MPRVCRQRAIEELDGLVEIAAGKRPHVAAQRQGARVEAVQRQCQARQALGFAEVGGGIGRQALVHAHAGLRIMTTGRYVANRPIYRAFSGTSASTAFGSSTAALVMAAEEARSGRLLTPRQVIAHLLNTADRFPALRACSMSGKRLNMEHAVRTPVPWIGGPPQDPP